MFGDLSVAENIFMGHAPRFAVSKALRIAPIDWKAMRERTAELLERLGMKIDPRTLVKDLSTAERHLVEIAKALSMEARVLIMDEPTSALSIHETEELFALVKKLKADGVAVVFISHKFEELFEIADYYTVLRDGRYIGEGSMKTRRKRPGEDDGRPQRRQLFPRPSPQSGRPPSRGGPFPDGHLQGYILRGAQGRDPRLFRLGRRRAQRGHALPHRRGPPGRRGSVPGWREGPFPQRRRGDGRGVVYVPEDRQKQGAILTMSIANNITLPQIGKLSRMGWLDPAREQAVALDYANSSK
jgi:rhamnose transport system ATP-binding protein